MASPLEDITLSSILRYGRDRLGGIAGELPNEIGANWRDLGDLAGKALIPPPVRMLTDALRSYRQGQERERRGGEASMTETPFATHTSGDPAVKGFGMIGDPMNIVGAGAGGAIVKKLSKAAALKEALEAGVPKSILKMGTSKEAREASAARRAAEAAELDAPVREVPRTAEERAAVAPDKYRQLYEAQGEQAVIDAAKAGEHIRPAPSGGGFTGFPRDITNKRGITRMRKSLDQQLADAKEALTYAEDPKRVDNWYERARAGIAESTEPWMMDRALEGHGTFSAGVAPENETAFVLRHGQSRALGAPQRGFRGAQERELDEAVAQNRAASLRFKIDEYRKKNDPRRQQDSPFGTNDFRSAQEFNYTQPGGEKWKAGVTDQMHPVMDAERALIVDRSRAGGDTAMTGERAQAYPWVYGKAEDMFLQGKFAGATDVESKVNALREANKTTADYYPKHTMSMTYGTRPGEGIGHRPDILALPLEQQGDYGINWTRPPMGADPHARDILYSAARLRQMPPLKGSGSWMGEAEPIGMARPLAYPEVGSVMELTPAQREAFQAIEMVRGLASGQRAVAGNLPVTMQSRIGKTGLLAERLRMNAVGNPESHLPTAAEMQALEPVAARFDYMVTPTSRGAQLMPKYGKDAFGHDISPPDLLMRELRKHGGFAEVEAALPGSSARQAATGEGFYREVMPPERHMGKGVATARALRQLAKAPPEVSRGISESDEVRRAIGKQHQVDVEAGLEGKKVSDPLQKSRRFLAQEDFNAVVELVRKGYKVPAAMGLLGFSLKGMASDDVAAIEREASR